MKSCPLLLLLLLPKPAVRGPSHTLNRQAHPHLSPPYEIETYVRPGAKNGARLLAGKFRFSALSAKTWLGMAGACRDAVNPRPCFGSSRALGLLLSRALSSRLRRSILRMGENTSSISLLREQIVDLEVLSNQTHAAVESVGGLLRRESLEAAVADAIVLPEIAVHGFETVVRLASD
jgi:hypothetical protein